MLHVYVPPDSKDAGAHAGALIQSLQFADSDPGRGFVPGETWALRSRTAHDVPNLLIPDGSVFVTAGSANPTTTIAAVALRAADRLPAARQAVARRGTAAPS